MRLTFLSLIAIFLTFTSCKNNGATAAQESAEPVSTTEVSWLGMGDVEAKLNQKKKKIIVDVYTPWCGPCKMMDKKTFSDPAIIARMNEDFYPVKFNAEGPDPIQFKGRAYANPGYNPAKARRRNTQHQLSPFFSVRGYPSVIVMDEDLNIIEKVTGYRNPEQFMQLLDKYSS